MCIFFVFCHMCREDIVFKNYDFYYYFSSLLATYKCWKQFG